jgi:hypothetical protein
MVDQCNLAIIRPLGYLRNSAKELRTNDEECTNSRRIAFAFAILTNCAVPTPTGDCQRQRLPMNKDKR